MDLCFKCKNTSEQGDSLVFGLWSLYFHHSEQCFTFITPGFWATRLWSDCWEHGAVFIDNSGRLIQDLWWSMSLFREQGGQFITAISKQTPEHVISVSNGLFQKAVLLMNDTETNFGFCCRFQSRMWENVSQFLPNSAAHVVSRTSRSPHDTEFLHQLPVLFRIDVVILLLVYRAPNGPGPIYLSH